MVNRAFPVICCSDLDTARDFYVELLDLAVVFESGWYTVLEDRSSPALQVGFVQSGHPTVPAIVGETAKGVLVTFEVDNVDAVHGRAMAMGAPIVLPLCDEDFGQRHFMAADPTGLVVDVMKPIRPSLSYLREVARRRRRAVR